MPVPSKNPRKAPQADFIEVSKFPFELMSSPTRAPRKGPAIIPTGPGKNPTMRPIVEPSVAALLPPTLFVINTGRTLSRIETATATAPVMIRHKTEISLCCEKCAAKRPAHARGAPGKTGTKVPRKPSKRRIPATIHKRIL